MVAVEQLCQRRRVRHAVWAVQGAGIAGCGPQVARLVFSDGEVGGRRRRRCLVQPRADEERNEEREEQRQRQ